MNAFARHHQPHFAFTYRCFDRILFNTYVQRFRWAGSVVSFLRDQRQATALTPAYFRAICDDYHRWLQGEAQQAHLPVVEPPPEVRRQKWVEPYYQALAGQPGVAVILKCRERARVAVSYPKRGHHVELAWRFVNLYYFYLQDAQLGRFFLRLCPYFPFNGQVCLNGHEWLACQLRREGIDFRKDGNAFVACAAPDRLQQLADAFGPEHIVAAVDPWWRRWPPYFTPREWEQGYRPHLYVGQVEYCHNLVFHRAAALDRLFDRLQDHNRAIGTPDSLAVIFGRLNFRADTRTAQTEVRITELKTPVLRTRWKSTSLKQYVKDHTLLRVEAASDQLQDLSVPKGVENLPKLREVLGRSTERFLEAEQDVLATYVDRGHLQRWRQPTVSATGRRTPGLRLDDPRLLAVLHALTSFAYLTGQACFRTADLLGDVQRALGCPDYRLSQLRYDLAKLRGKGLVSRRQGKQQYELSPEGYRLAVLYQKLYHWLYAPLTAGLLDPVPSDNCLPRSRKAKLDRLYEAIGQALQQLSEAVGVAA